MKKFLLLILLSPIFTQAQNKTIESYAVFWMEANTYDGKSTRIFAPPIKITYSNEHGASEPIRIKLISCLKAHVKSLITSKHVSLLNTELYGSFENWDVEGGIMPNYEVAMEDYNMFSKETEYVETIQTGYDYSNCSIPKSSGKNR